MADELSARLARRQQIIAGEAPAPAENIEPKCYENNADDKDATDSADNELANKLKRFVETSCSKII